MVTVVEVLVNEWISRFGVLLELEHSDQGNSWFMIVSEVMRTALDKEDKSNS